MSTPDNKMPKKPEKPAPYVPPKQLDPDKAMPEELLKFIMARTTELPQPKKPSTGPLPSTPPKPGTGPLPSQLGVKPPTGPLPAADVVSVKCLCGKVLRAPKSLCGQPVKCPGCGKTFRLPTPK